MSAYDELRARRAHGINQHPREDEETCRRWAQYHHVLCPVCGTPLPVYRITLDMSFGHHRDFIAQPENVVRGPLGFAPPRSDGRTHDPEVLAIFEAQAA